MSADIGELAAALAAFQGECPKIEKECTVRVATRSGGSYSFQYASLDNILDKVRPILAKNGLSITQLTDSSGSLTTLLLHKSGQYIGSNIKITGAKLRDSGAGSDGTSPQEYGSAITYMRRYSVTSLLGLSTEDDEDGNLASGNTAEKYTAPTKWLNQNTPEWEQAVTDLKYSNKTLADIKKEWKVNKQCEEILGKIKPEAAPQTPPAATAPKQTAKAGSKVKELLIDAIKFSEYKRLTTNIDKASELFGIDSEETRDEAQKLEAFNKANRKFSTTVDKLAAKTVAIPTVEEHFELLPEVKDYFESL